MKGIFSGLILIIITLILEFFRFLELSFWKIKRQKLKIFSDEYDFFG